jgi:long-chain acyl-CoA synthetase
LFGNRERAGGGTGLAQRMPDGQLFAMALQDDLHWLDERHFELAGRKDEQVQVGGHNISPQQVRGLLLQHDAVADAAVRLDVQQQPARLKAFVVPKTGVTLDFSAFETWAHAHLLQSLPPIALPSHYSYGAALPSNSMGKLSDW